MIFILKKTHFKVRRLLAFSLLVSIFEVNVCSQNSFPYKINRSDYYLISAAIGINVASILLEDTLKENLTLDEIRKLNRSQINYIDRFASFNRNTKIGNIGDVTSLVLPVLPLLLTTPEIYNKNWNNLLVYGLMYLEVYYLTSGITSVIKSLSLRTRPFYYNNSFSPERRYALQGNDVPEGKTSFISGHSSRSFAAAVFLSKTFNDIYGNNTASKIIWGTSLSVAAFTAYSRVADGEHFPTDVIAGAIVGTAIGYIVPTLHKAKTHTTSVNVLPDHVSIAFRF